MTETIVVGIREAHNRFSELVGKAEAGDDVVIARHGKPVVRFSSVQDAVRNNGERILAVLEQFSSVPRVDEAVLAEQIREEKESWER